MYGIDVSNNNGKLTSIGSAGFVLAKCTEGTDFIDVDYDYYAQLAEAHHAQFGAFHYFHAENLNARAQAHFFLQHATPRNYLSLWVDYEVYGISGAVDAAELGLFISTVKLVYPTAKVGVYANTVGLERISPYLSEIPLNAIWYANPSIAVGAKLPNLPAWQIHQFATVGGVDQDYTSWTGAEMQSFFTW